MMTANTIDDTLPENIESVINQAVDRAFERTDFDALIRDAIREMDIASIVRRTIAEVQSG